VAFVFKKGISGNLKFWPKVTGKRLGAHKQKEHERAKLARLKVGLEEIDKLHAQRSKLIENYVLGAGEFAYREG
jgi:hypothetical protein